MQQAASTSLANHSRRGHIWKCFPSALQVFALLQVFLTAPLWNTVGRVKAQPASTDSSTSTAAAVPATLPLASSPWSLASPGELSPQQQIEEGSLSPPQWSRGLGTRVSFPLPTHAFSIVRYLLACLLPEHGVEAEELPPKIWPESSLRQRQMSLTFTAFQELKSLSSLALTGEIAQNLFSFQSLPRGKNKLISMQVYLFCVFLILYFTNQCQLSVIESRHSC